MLTAHKLWIADPSEPGEDMELLDLGALVVRLPAMSAIEKGLTERDRLPSFPDAGRALKSISLTRGCRTNSCIRVLQDCRRGSAAS